MRQWTVLYNLLQHNFQQLSCIWLQRDEYQHVSDPFVLHAADLRSVEYIQDEALVHIQAILDCLGWRCAHRVRQLSIWTAIATSQYSILDWKHHAHYWSNLV